MAKNRLSLMEAYMIETLRSNGVSDQEILTQVEKKDVSEWSAFNSKFQFKELIELNGQDPERFQSVLTDGYQVKFVTFKGLKNLLELKFGFEEDKHYQLTDKGLTRLHITDSQLAEIRQLLSRNWAIEELSADAPNEKTIKIELA